MGAPELRVVVDWDDDVQPRDPNYIYLVLTAQHRVHPGLWRPIYDAGVGGIECARDAERIVGFALAPDEIDFHLAGLEDAAYLAQLARETLDEARGVLIKRPSKGGCLLTGRHGDPEAS